VGADHHWCARTQRVHHIWQIYLVKVNYIGIERQYVAKALTHRHIGVKQIGAAIYSYAGDLLAGFDARGEHAYVEAVLGEDPRAALDVGGDPAVSRPAWNSQ
jgi:hypothetical protein